MKKRIFVAVELSPEVKMRIEELQEKLRSDEIFSKFGVKFVNPEVLHITLIFLGEIDEVQIRKLTAVCEESVLDVTPFLVTLEGLGAFPKQKQAFNIWIGMKENDKLIRLQRIISERLHNLGFDLEVRDFIPHLTILRLKKKYDVSGILSKIENIKFGRIEIPSITIYESELLRDGPIHKMLEKIKFGGKQ